MKTGRESSENERVEKNQKVSQALKRLNTSYNPTLNALVMTDVAFIVGGYDDYENPVTFDDAWNYPIDEDCVLLEKSLYGLVQAARQFYKKLVEVLVNELNFEKFLAEPCLLMKYGDSGIVIFAFMWMTYYVLVIVKQ